MSIIKNLKSIIFWAIGGFIIGTILSIIFPKFSQLIQQIPEIWLWLVVIIVIILNINYIFFYKPKQKT